MLKDFVLASLHHLLAFGLVAMIVVQSVLLSRGMDAATLRRLSGIDRGLGMAAMLLLIVGLLRVFQGIKGADFYLHNPWFHAKLGAFVLAAILSILPTIRFVRWRKALKADPGFVPPPAEVAATRRFVRIELALIAVILVAAAGMARYGGLSL
jgi:putative membrane protein